MPFSYNPRRSYYKYNPFSQPKQKPKPHSSPISTKEADESSPAMSPEIWTKLPEEILELILSLLPLKTFLNLRSTCKNFNSLVFSPSFASKHTSSSSSSSFSSFLLLSHPQFQTHLNLYDSSLATWRDLSLSLSSSSLLSSSGGLLCFSLPSATSFLIRNVLSNSSREVKFPFYPFSFHSLSLISTPSSGYFIFALSHSGTFIYTSATGSWAGPGRPAQSETRHESHPFFRDRVWLASAEPPSVSWFHVASFDWGRSTAPMPGDLTFARLVSRAGERLILVGGVGSNGISRRVGAWELNEEESEWVEISRVPEMMCQKLMSVSYHNYSHVYSFWHEGMLCVGCYTWPEILYYKWSRMTWHWLPRSPSLHQKWSCGFRWFSFVPDLYALV